MCSGDFNINILDHNATVHDFNMKIVSCGFVNLIETATRVTCATASALDLIIMNIETSVFSSGTIASDVNDHCPVFVVFRNEHAKRNNVKESITVQRITDASLEAFKHDIMNFDWSYVLQKTDVNDAYDLFFFFSPFPSFLFEALYTRNVHKKIRKR